eukprot:GHVU01034516.1.p1 GENE.GHVU01034516.1~~GHVU01034516.1.p1  ORF type:complete len:227 (+),score=12.74 GHVU01034516.1:564-1244(+)
MDDATPSLFLCFVFTLASLKYIGGTHAYWYEALRRSPPPFTPNGITSFICSATTQTMPSAERVQQQSAAAIQSLLLNCFEIFVGRKLRTEMRSLMEWYNEVRSHPLRPPRHAKRCCRILMLRGLPQKCEYYGRGVSLATRLGRHAEWEDAQDDYGDKTHAKRCPMELDFYDGVRVMLALHHTGHVSLAQLSKVIGEPLTPEDRSWNVTLAIELLYAMRCTGISVGC